MRVYGVPRGGIPVAYLVADEESLSETPGNATLIVDDIVDSGKTKDRYEKQFPETTFLALADFLDPAPVKGQWIVFPWENGATDTSGDDIVIRLLQYIGEDPNREGLKETPQRVLNAWKEFWAEGYGKDPAVHFKCFQDGGEKYDEMLWEKDLPFYSHCEHHLAPFFGTITIAYIPNNRVLGISKFKRVLDVFARRLQVQERLTVQIADTIQKHLDPKGVGVVIKARHLCMESRGVSCQGQTTVTSALRGVFLEPAVRNEFLAIAR